MTGEKFQVRDGWALFAMIAVVACIALFCSGERSSASPPPQVVYREPAHVAPVVTPAPVKSEPTIIYVTKDGGSFTPPAVNINNVVHLGNERDVPITVKQGTEQRQEQSYTSSNTVNYQRRDPRCEETMNEYNKFLAEHEQRRKIIIGQQ